MTYFFVRSDHVRTKIHCSSHKNKAVEEAKRIESRPREEESMSGRRTDREWWRKIEDEEDVDEEGKHVEEDEEHVEEESEWIRRGANPL